MLKLLRRLILGKPLPKLRMKTVCVTCGADIDEDCDVIAHVLTMAFDDEDEPVKELKADV